MQFSLLFAKVFSHQSFSYTVVIKSIANLRLVRSCSKKIGKTENRDQGSVPGSGVTRSMVIPGPETEVIGESGSGGLGAQPLDAEKGLILHVLRIF